MSMGNCPRLPSGKVREIIEQTVETGKEHGFVICDSGDASKVVSGSEDGMSIEGALNECDLDAGPVDVVHTHPNGVKKLSNTDRKAAAHDSIGSVCVAVKGGGVLCESIDTCEREVGK